ncbi:unnamed protein product [Lathyrus sativus]|nr:unnamed protein product [Lathyrus sativus]
MHSREKLLFPQRRRTPSFSSILLDTIDHSIDEDENLNQKPCLYKNGMEKQRMNLRQAVMIEDWMEKNYTSTSSSECSSGGIFSSSETDSSYNKQRSKTRKHMNLIHHINSEKQQQQQQQQNKKKKKKQQGWEDGFTRTKLRALKIYGELNQKVKQPISPGSKIATFLSSIFNSHNVKKAKMCYVGAAEDVSFDHKSKSPCFSSSVSRRSCMSKTAPSKSNNGVKRTVRFYPVSVILGEDSEQQQQKPSTVRKSTRNSVKEVKKINNVVVGDKEKGGEKNGFDFRRLCDNGEDDDDDDDEDDNDAVSYSSSDLFELDHLIGDGRFREELPVYETTNLETNKAIANGLCL